MQTLSSTRWSQSSPQSQMNDPSAESELHQRDLELLQLVREIQASNARKAALENQEREVRKTELEIQNCQKREAELKIKASEARKAGLEDRECKALDAAQTENEKIKALKATIKIKDWPREALDNNKEFRKLLAKFTCEVLARSRAYQQILINQWSGIFDVESIVAEAIVKTLIEAVKKIEKYDPDRGSVMTWINKIFYSRFLDTKAQYQAHYTSISFDNPDAMVEAEIAEMPEPETDSRASELVRFIKADPEGHLAATHIRKYPEATLQRILLMRIDNLKLQEIADRFNLSSHSTIDTFMKRQLRNLNNYFRKYLCE